MALNKGIIIVSFSEAVIPSFFAFSSASYRYIHILTPTEKIWLYFKFSRITKPPYTPLLQPFFIA